VNRATINVLAMVAYGRRNGSKDRKGQVWLLRAILLPLLCCFIAELSIGAGCFTADYVLPRSLKLLKHEKMHE
jgi:hypothetical protein